MDERQWYLKYGFWEDWATSWFLAWYDADGLNRRALELEKELVFNDPQYLVDPTSIETHAVKKAWDKVNIEVSDEDSEWDKAQRVFLSGVQVLTQALGFAQTIAFPYTTPLALNELTALAERLKPQHPSVLSALAATDKSPAAMVGMMVAPLIDQAIIYTRSYQEWKNGAPRNEDRESLEAATGVMSLVVSWAIAKGDVTAFKAIVEAEKTSPQYTMGPEGDTLTAQFVGFMNEQTEPNRVMVQNVGRRLRGADTTVIQEFRATALPGSIDPESQEAATGGVTYGPPVDGRAAYVRRLLEHFGALGLDTFESYELIQALGDGKANIAEVTAVFGNAGRKVWFARQGGDGLIDSISPADNEISLRRALANTTTLFDKKTRDQLLAALPTLQGVWRDTMLALPPEQQKDFEEWAATDVVSSAVQAEGFLVANDEQRAMRTADAQAAAARTPGAGAFIRLGLAPQTAEELASSLYMQNELPSAYMARLATVLPEVLAAVQVYEPTMTIDTLFNTLRRDGALPPTIDQLLEVLDSHPAYAGVVTAALTTSDVAASRAALMTLSAAGLIDTTAFVVAELPDDFTRTFQALINEATAAEADPIRRALLTQQYTVLLPEKLEEFQRRGVSVTPPDQAAIRAEEAERYVRETYGTGDEDIVLTAKDYDAIRTRTAQRVAAETETATTAARTAALADFAARQEFGQPGAPTFQRDEETGKLTSAVRITTGGTTTPRGVAHLGEGEGLAAAITGGSPFSGISRSVAVPTLEGQFKDAILAYVRTLPVGEQLDALNQLASQVGAFEAEFALQQPTLEAAYAQERTDYTKSFQGTSLADANEDALIAQLEATTPDVDGNPTAEQIANQIANLKAQRKAREQAATYAYGAGLREIATPFQRYLAGLNLAGRVTKPATGAALPLRRPTLTRRY